MSYTNRGFDTNHDVKENGGGGYIAPYPEVKENGGGGGKENGFIIPPPDYNKIVQDSPSVYVIGSGDFGRALAGRLAKSGYRVTIASRDGGVRNR